jgi:hypothetical protein
VFRQDPQLVLAGEHRMLGHLAAVVVDQQLPWKACTSTSARSAETARVAVGPEAHQVVAGNDTTGSPSCAKNGQALLLVVDLRH